MKKAVIFYSFEGNTKLMAETIAAAIGADLLELRPKKEIRSKGFMRYVWGGRAALMKIMPELLPFDKDVQGYDLIFIGTPVWAFTYAPPLRSFFAVHPLKDKKIAFFCCHGGGKGNIFGKVKTALKNCHILGEIDFKEPLRTNTAAHIAKARTWASDIIAQAGI
jgi:flavodoxin